MNVSRILPALGVLAVFLFLAGLALNGPMDDVVGRHERFFALIINGMIEQFGTMGSAGIFAGLGLALGGFTLFGSGR